MDRDTVSCLMLFCALILVQKDRATLPEVLILAPLDGPGKPLAEKSCPKLTVFCSRIIGSAASQTVPPKQLEELIEYSRSFL